VLQGGGGKERVNRQLSLSPADLSLAGAAWAGLSVYVLASCPPCPCQLSSLSSPAVLSVLDSCPLCPRQLSSLSSSGVLSVLASCPLCPGKLSSLSSSAPRCPRQVSCPLCPRQLSSLSSPAVLAVLASCPPTGTYHCFSLCPTRGYLIKNYLCRIKVKSCSQRFRR
jgi:hypothetical protein